MALLLSLSAVDLPKVLGAMHMPWVFLYHTIIRLPPYGLAQPFL
jgi:hypothetical protein